jgi:hypothetical protein
MAVNKVTTAFHDEYWHYRRAHYPHIQMRKPGEKGSKSTWIIMRGASFPKGVQVHHKLDQSVVELGFDRRTVGQLRALGKVWPAGVVPDQKAVPQCFRYRFRGLKWPRVWRHNKIN